MKLFLLYYDYDNGSSESWNTFYTPVEVFATEEERTARIEFITNQIKNDPDLEIDLDNDEFVFHTVDKDLMTPEASAIPINVY